MSDAVPVMQIQTANALITGAPIAVDQLHAAKAHFETLATLLSRSGPRFANPQRDAANMHNKAVARIRESIVEARLRETRAVEAASGLVEIEIQ